MNFLQNDVSAAYDAEADVHDSGFHLDIFQSFGIVMEPSVARETLQKHNYGLNRRLDGRFTDANKRDYGCISIALVPDRTERSGFKVVMPDGQHTLDIIGKNDHPTPCMVLVFQVQNDVGLDRLFSTFDSGRRRYFEQALSHAMKTDTLDDEYPNQNILRRVPGAVEWVREGFVMKRGLASPNSAKLEMLRSDPEVSPFCKALGRAIGGGTVGSQLPTRGVLAALFCIYLNTDADTFHRFNSFFWLGAAEDETLPPSHPIAILRNKLATRAPRQTNEIDHLSWTHSAWVSFKKGENSKKRINSRDLTPEKMRDLDW